MKYKKSAPGHSSVLHLNSSVACPPKHLSPPVQNLDLVRVPPPQVALHVTGVHRPQTPQTPIGHRSSLHVIMDPSLANPGQSAPPNLGGGLLHCLVLICLPPPQLTLQVKELQGPHSPSTGQG